MRILFKFPSRSRPQRFIESLDSIISNVESDDYALLISLDEDDPTLTEYDRRLRQYMESHRMPNCTIAYGTSTSKIHAINRDVHDYEEGPFADPFSILCLHSDDFFFTKLGFDQDIREAFNEFSGLVHFPDQAVGNRLCTYPMMSKYYYNQFGYIYHPSYISVFADNEQHEVARQRGQYKFVDKKIFEHRHPIWGYGQADELLTHTESFYAEDMETFKQRQAAGFP